MKRQTLKLVIGLLALLAFTGEANALYVGYTPDAGVLGQIQTGPVPSTAPPTFVINSIQTNPNSRSALTGPLSYLDSVTFSSLSSASILNISLSAPSTILGYSNNVSDIIVRLYQIGLGNSYSQVGLYNFSGNTLNSANNFSFNLASNSNYLLRINPFDLVSYPPSTYGYTLGATFSPTPVPEPTEGALILSGIGLLGFIASRRKNTA